MTLGVHIKYAYHLWRVLPTIFPSNSGSTFTNTSSDTSHCSHSDHSSSDASHCSHSGHSSSDASHYPHSGNSSSDASHLSHSGNSSLDASHCHHLLRRIPLSSLGQLLHRRILLWPLLRHITLSSLGPLLPLSSLGSLAFAYTTMC